MNNATNQQLNSDTVFSTIVFPLGFILGASFILSYSHWISPNNVAEPGAFQFPLVTDLVSFVASSLAKDPLLIVIGATMFLFFIGVSSLARLKGIPTGKLLALFKSTGFSISLALVAVKLPRILEEDFQTAAAIAPVYQTLGWIIFAVAGASLVELLRETGKIFFTSTPENHE